MEKREAFQEATQTESVPEGLKTVGPAADILEKAKQRIHVDGNMFDQAFNGILFDFGITENGVAVTMQLNEKFFTRGPLAMMKKLQDAGIAERVFVNMKSARLWLIQMARGESTAHTIN